MRHAGLFWIASLLITACGGGSPSTTTSPPATVPQATVPPTASPAPTAPPTLTLFPATAALPTPTALATPADAPVTATLPISPAAATGTPLRTPTANRPIDAAGKAPPSHIFLIVMENHNFEQVIGNPDAPFINQLTTQYALAEQYYSVIYTSLPNYLALTGGDTFGVKSDCEDCFFDNRNIVDALEAKGRTWKSYQEDLPSPCFLGSGAQKYTIHHDPFLYYNNIRSDLRRCNQVVPLSQLDADLQANRVPDFTWITPNLIHDMHDGTVADGDRWLASMVPTIMASDTYKQNGQLFIVWDEGTVDETCCGVRGGGRVPLLAIAPTGPKDYRSTTPATHYSLLRTIEDLWGLEQLGHSGDADVTALCDLLPASGTCTR